jgi:hypothetical protein
MRYGKPKRTYYWIHWFLAGTKSGGLIGPCVSEDEANEKAISECHGYQYEVIPLDTRDKSAASGKLKAIILHKTKDMGQAMQRVRHQVPTNQPTGTEVRFI